MDNMSDIPNLPVDPRRYQRDKARVERGFWAKVRRTLGRVPFLEEAVAAYYCAVDRQTPVQVKAILMGALAYFVLPADTIPDFIAWLGFADDAAVLALAIRTVEPHIKEHHRRQARAIIAGGAEEPSGPA
ncbi:MAG: YkvA family protein [Kiloniellales bacterium]|nr:YkvA family protein [Kiloniellales bacterium]